MKNILILTGIILMLNCSAVYAKAKVVEEVESEGNCEVIKLSKGTCVLNCPYGGAVTLPRQECE